MQIMLKKSVCTNPKITKQYAHNDCAAFADIIMWQLHEQPDIESRLIMAGDRTQNHFYVQAKSKTGETFFIDAYGVFDNENEILSRYAFTKEDTCYLNDFEEDLHFRMLVEKADAYVQTTEEGDEIFSSMQQILQDWTQSLINEAKISQSNYATQISHMLDGQNPRKVHSCDIQ